MICGCRPTADGRERPLPGKHFQVYSCPKMTNPSEKVTSSPGPVKAWPAGRIMEAVLTLLWLLMALAGIFAIEGILDQHVPGYPNEGQLRFNVVIPLSGLTISAAALIFSKRLPNRAKRLMLTISFLTLLFVFLTFGGGV